MYFKLVPTNECEIIVTPRSAGDFGLIRISGRERTPNEELRICEEIVGNIKRHVDDIGWTNIQQKHVYETEDGEQFDTLYEVLQYLYDEDEKNTLFEYRYVRPRDGGAGTRRSAKSFEELIEAAYQNPWQFEVLRGPELTEAQRKFLNRVKEATNHDQTTQA